MDLNFVIQSLLNGLLIGGVYSLIAIGLTLIFGVMKVINFAHGAVMMLGMYCTYWLFVLLKINPYLSILLVIPLLFLVGAAFQKFLINPIIKAPEHNQLFLTLGVMLFLQNLAVFLWSPDYRILKTRYADITYYIGDISISLSHLLAFGLAVLFSCNSLRDSLPDRPWPRHSGCERTTRRSHPDGNQHQANLLDLLRHWVGMRGRLSGAAVTTFFPIYPYVGDIFILTAYVVVVLGGLGSVSGAFVGGLIIGLADSIGAMFLPGAMKSIMSFVIFILILLFRPTGLFGK